MISARPNAAIVTVAAVAVALWALASVSLVAGCAVHRPIENPKPPIDVPAAYTGAQAADEAAAPPLPERWWDAFSDPELSRLIDQALAGSLQLQVAWARIEQARAVARQASSGKWPQINATATARRSSERFFFGPQPIEVTNNQFAASVSASYEVDLWKKVGSRARAAHLDWAASRDDLETAALSLVAEVSEAWFDVVVQRETRALLEAQLATNETSVELVRLRFEEGLGASAVDVFQARQQVIATRAQLALVGAVESIAANRLAVLLGRAPGSLQLAERAELPALPPLPGTGLPMDLLLRRPDVRAIRRRVEAADWRVAAAVADRLPSLSLSADGRLNGTEVGDLIATPLYTLAASLLAPIFDGGRRAAEADRSRAVVAELTAAFGQTLLVALLEVENALALERAQLAYIAEIQQQIEVSTATVREARNRYREGITDYLPVLTAQQTLQRAEQSLVSARRQLLSHRIQLCRALGGTWTAELGRVSEPAGDRDSNGRRP